MKKLHVILSISVLVLFSGCASMFVPDSDLANKVPVLEMGSLKHKPEGNEFILHIPAGATIPVHFSVKGGLISSPIDQKSVTKIKQELYVYKYWASLDGKTWQPTGDIINMPISVGVGPEGGQIEVKVDFQK